MITNNIISDWTLSFNKTIKEIQKLIATNPKDDLDTISFKKLAIWLLENNYDSYDYLTHDYASFKSDPFQTKKLLNELHHSLLDDGDIAFVNMSQEGEIKRVFMIFQWSNDESFTSACQNENKMMIDSIIQSRKSQFLFNQELLEKFPEKNITFKPLLHINSFQFDSHQNPDKFISDFENFQQKKIKLLNDRKSKTNKL